MRAGLLRTRSPRRAPRRGPEGRTSRRTPASPAAAVTPARLRATGAMRTTDDEEDDQGEQLPLRLAELVDARADGALGVAEGQPGDERGDEAVAAHELGRREGQAGEAENGQPLEGCVHPTRARTDRAMPRPPRYPTARPRQRAQRHLQDREREPVGEVGALAGRAREGDRDENERQSDAVVEAALHVEALADRCGSNPAMSGPGLWTGRPRWRGSGSPHRDLGDIP